MNTGPQRWLRSGVLTLGALILLLGGQSVAAESKEASPSKEAPPSKEEPPEFRFDFGLFGGGHFFDNNHSLGRGPADPAANIQESPAEISPKSGGVFGGRLGLHFNRWIGLEAEVDATPTKTRAPRPDNQQTTKMWVFGYRGSVIVNLTDSYQFQPFILAGYGGLTSLVSDSNVVPGSTWGFMHAGLGFKVGFTPWTGLRVDGRIMAPWTALSPVIPQGSRIGYSGPDFEVLGSLFVNFGEIEKVHIYSTVIRQPKTGDRDGDGIPDNVDKCPDQPEDKDGFQDEDGCPDLDNDGDGIPDAIDKCPNEPEDKDGFQDEDGCPDPDNDGDGIPDIIDKCPNEPETFNNYQDADGCPDEVPAAVKKFTGVIEGINFKTASADILPGSYVLLDRAAKVLQDYPDVGLEISGHTDNRGKADYNRDLSQRRADAVKTYFVTRGVASERLQSIGYGPTRPIANNKTQSGRATNRRTEFRLIDVPPERKEDCKSVNLGDARLGFGTVCDPDSKKNETCKELICLRGTKKEGGLVQTPSGLTKGFPKTTVEGKVDFWIWERGSWKSGACDDVKLELDGSIYGGSSGFGPRFVPVPDIRKLIEEKLTECHRKIR
jgi:OOP family OmpA-OmpF porin